MAQGVAEYANVIIPEAELEPEPETAGAEQQPAEDPAEPEAEEPEQDLEPEADGDEDPQSEKAEKPEYSDKMRLTETGQSCSSLPYLQEENLEFGSI